MVESCILDCNRKESERKRLGSTDYFAEEWSEALQRDGGRWLIYPMEDPDTQFALFEQMKAAEIVDLLAKYNVMEGRVLEYGCGAAGMSVYLANKGYDAVACDISLNGLRIARLNARHHLDSESRGRLSLCTADAFHLPFPDATFRVVMSYGLLEHFDSGALDSVLREVVRTLEPGGLFVADIAHGRLSSRTIGAGLSLIASLIFHASSLKFSKLPIILRNGHDLYENDLTPRQWTSALQRVGLRQVGLRVCHPFPPLALAGRWERAYVRWMELWRPVWSWFHRMQPSWCSRLGWLYVVWGVR